MESVISLIGFFLAIFVVVVGAFKDINIIILSILGSLIVAVSNRLNIIEVFFYGEHSYMEGMSGFFSQYFIIFLLGSILAKYIETSGAATTLVNWMLKIINKDKPYSVLLFIYLSGAFLTYGGVSIFVVLFILVPIARNLFKEFNLSWRLVITPYFMGVATFTMTMLPGSPAIQNVIPAKALGTTLMAAPQIGVLSTIVVVLWALWRMKVELNEAIRNRETFEANSQELDQIEVKGNPNLFSSILPLVILLATIFIGSSLKIDDTIIYALSFAVFTCLFIYRKFVRSSIETLNQGAINSLTPVIFPACAVGFGTVVAHSDGFQLIFEGIKELPFSSVISLSLLTAFLSSIIGTSAGTLGIVMDGFVSSFPLQGENLEVVHRLVSIASGVMPPQAGVILTMYLLTGLNHKKTYKNLFLSLNVGVFLAFIVSYLFTLFF